MVFHEAVFERVHNHWSNRKQDNKSFFDQISGSLRSDRTWKYSFIRKRYTEILHTAINSIQQKQIT